MALRSGKEVIIGPSLTAVISIDIIDIFVFNYPSIGYIVFDSCPL